VVDYNLLFMFFSFVWGWGVPSAHNPAVLGWVGELCVVLVAHLFLLQVYTDSFETSQWGEMPCCFSQGRPLLGQGSAQQGIGSLSTG
jgi:hypothetical protein